MREGVVLILAIGFALLPSDGGAALSQFPPPSSDVRGRFIAFDSTAENLAPGDSVTRWDVFMRDRVAGTTALISQSHDRKSGGNNMSLWPSISADGRYVAFMSVASNLVPADTNREADTFVRDLVANTTERVSVGRDGVEGNASSYSASISGDGRYVAFMSLASNLVAKDVNGWADVFVRDRVAGTTELISVSSAEAQGDRISEHAAISEDGRYVAFASNASNLVLGDTNETGDIFVRDRLTGTTELVSVSSEGAPGNDWSYSETSLSSDGRYVAFDSAASNLVPGDSNSTYDIFVRDRVQGTTERTSVSSDGGQTNETSYNPSLSADGRFVAFSSVASNLVAGDTNTYIDVFVRDRATDTTSRVSVTGSGAQAEGRSYDGSISPNGRVVVFKSKAPNLAAAQINDQEWGDTFVRDLVAETTEHVSVKTTPATAAGLLVQPAKPRAGRSLTASIAITQGGKPVVSANVACKASVDEKPLPASARVYRNGRARCRWMIPAGGKGMTLRGRIAASTPNGSVLRTFRARVA